MMETMKGFQWGQDRETEGRTVENEVKEVTWEWEADHGKLLSQ